jgi:hypothetical protein
MSIVKYTLVKTRISFLSNDTRKSLEHALLLVAVRLDVHLALDGDVRIGHRSGKELAKGAEEKGDGGSDLALLLNCVLHLLEQSVLQNWVDDENKGRNNTSEEGLRSLILEKRHQGTNGTRSLDRLRGLASLHIGLLVLLAGRDSGVDDPDGIGNNDGGRSRNCSGDHGLDGSELLVRATGLGRRLLKESPGPLIPIVVDEVGDADAEQGRVNTGVEARDTFASDNLLDGLDKLALGLLGLDLCASGKGDERVSGCCVNAVRVARLGK